MARIVVQAVHADGELRRWTLSERVVAENLDSDHYVAQLLERLTWAVADAAALESRSADLPADHHRPARDDRPPIRSRRSGSRPLASGRRVRA